MLVLTALAAISNGPVRLPDDLDQSICHSEYLLTCMGTCYSALKARSGMVMTPKQLQDDLNMCVSANPNLITQRPHGMVSTLSEVHTDAGMGHWENVPTPSACWQWCQTHSAEHQLG